VKTLSLRHIKDGNPAIRKLIEEWDVAEELRQWAEQLQQTRTPWVTTVNWGAPRKDNVFHPSSLNNSCDQYLYLEYVGALKREKMNSGTKLIMDAGTLLEHQYQYYQHTRALREGYAYDSSFPVWKHGRLAKELALGGEADGLMDRELVLSNTRIDLRCIFEYKSINKDGFSGLRTKPSIKYVRQVQAYLASMDIPLCVIVYINRDNSEPRHFFVWYSPDIWSPLEERVRSIKQKADNFEFVDKNTGNTCKWCKFFEDCAPFPKKRKTRLL
jgi:hypothetical protein